MSSRRRRSVELNLLPQIRSMQTQQTEELKGAAREAGCDLVGIADLAPFKAERAALPDGLLDGFVCAVSVAIHLDDSIVDGIGGGPTPAYARHYRQANTTLDAITARLAEWIASRGCAGHAIPASQVVDANRLLASISHKAVARLAGIGWQGKSLLIVSPQYGPRIRLATVLTDMPLICDRPLKNRCGTCDRCTRACPAGAIKNVGTKDRYGSRQDALHLDRCVERTLQFKANPEVGAQICGVCVQVWSFGKISTRRRRGNPA
jgi:epoxyqueuosine reductase QueG